MSELKATTVYDAYWKANSVGEGTGIQVYLKSEADKVIDFWKNESHNHYERWFNLNTQYEGWLGKVMRCERAERELRRNKYKRCLAMAKWCNRMFSSTFGKERYWQKWNRRWLELAEVFKHNKEAKRYGVSFEIL